MSYVDSCQINDTEYIQFEQIAIHTQINFFEKSPLWSASILYENINFAEMFDNRIKVLLVLINFSHIHFQHKNIIGQKTFRLFQAFIFDCI